MPTVPALLTSAHYFIDQALIASAKLPAGHPVRVDLGSRVAVLRSLLVKIEERTQSGAWFVNFARQWLHKRPQRSVVQLTHDVRNHCLAAARYTADDLPLGDAVAVSVVTRMFDVERLMRDVAEQVRPFARLRAWWRKRSRS